MTRAQAIADMPHGTRHTLVSNAEWHGWLWWLHDRRGQCPPGGEDGAEAARIVLARDEAARTP